MNFHYTANYILNKLNNIQITLKKSIIWLRIYELHLFHHITQGKSQLCVSEHQAA